MSERSELMRQWVTAVFSELRPGTRLDIAPASDDASFRRYFRVRSGTHTYILMDAPPAQEDCRPWLHIAGLLQEAGLNAPRLVAADAARGLVLMTDLGSRCYLDVLDEDNVERLYADALRALLRMQTHVVDPSLPVYDTQLLRAELDLFAGWFLERHLGLTLSSHQRAVLEQSFDLLCQSALEQPRVFVHRDYHSRNLMYAQGMDPGILDFQDAVRGPITYDLVSLLRDVYIRWPAAAVERWALAYRSRLLAAGLLEEHQSGCFLRWFDLMGVQRHLKVAGIFARLFHRDGKPRYLADIPLTLHYLQEVCARYSELAPLRELSATLGIGERLTERNAAALGRVSA